MVIGGGVVGVSIAYHLADAGYRPVTLLERRTLGSGTSAKGTGGIRQQFSTAVNVELSRRAVRYFERFADRVGEPIPSFRQHGYLFLLKERHLSAFERAAALQRSLGVEATLLDPDAITSVVPYVDARDLAGATYCPTDGSASTLEVLAAFARAARRAGAELREHTEVVGITRDGGGAVAGVETTGGHVDAGLVVDAAGPWAARVGRLAGADLPILPVPRQAFEVIAPDWLTPGIPLTVDVDSGAYLHPRDGRAIVGGTDRASEPNWSTEVDWTGAERVVDALGRRIPTLGSPEAVAGWAGLRDMSPDDHAILGPVPEVPGFWVAAGFSGHGFMHAPVVGEELARWLLHGNPDVDLGPLRSDRFADAAGSTRTEAVIF